MVKTHCRSVSVPNACLVSVHTNGIRRMEPEWRNQQVKTKVEE
jgi:hypothetical protein